MRVCGGCGKGLAERFGELLGRCRSNMFSKKL
jgi:hypothetical protein